MRTLDYCLVFRIFVEKAFVMPYRRLPNTDQARLRALQTAFNKAEQTPPLELAITESSYNNLRSFVPRFFNAISNYKNAYKAQSKKSKEYAESTRKARLYVSHFIQVLNMSILRGELKPSTRDFYDLQDYDKSVPLLTSEQELLAWGRKLIDGDQNRIMKGGSPIYNPSIALVRVNYEKFSDNYFQQKVLQSNTDRTWKQVVELRSFADDLILKIWNEIEGHFKDLSENEKRKKSSEYGLIYVYRKNEVKVPIQSIIERATESSFRFENSLRL